MHLQLYCIFLTGLFIWTRTRFRSFDFTLLEGGFILVFCYVGTNFLHLQNKELAALT